MYSIPCITRTRNLQMVIVRYLSLSTWQHHQNHYKNRIGLPSDKRTNRWKIHHSLHGKAMDFHSYLFTRGYSTQVYPQKDPTTRWKNPWKSTIYKLSHFQGFCSYQFPISEDSSSSAGGGVPAGARDPLGRAVGGHAPQHLGLCCAVVRQRSVR